MSKVSVIIPVYNVEAYLPACLDSVLGQTLRDLEVICIDDCSPDRCGEILDEYAAADSRVRVIHLPENHRQGYGRNRGLERAEGEYVYFLDSDDMIEPESLEELTALADRERLDAVFFDSRSIFENEELKKIYQPPESRKGVYREDTYTGKELLEAFLRQNEWTCLPQRIFWRRDFLLREGILYPEGCEHEDEFFAFAGILTAGRARYVRKQYFIYRIRPGSVMTREVLPRDFHGYLMIYYYMNRFMAERDLQDDSAQLIISRIHERATTLFSKLKEDPGQDALFAKDPDRILYRCFLSDIRAYGTDTIDAEVLEKIRQYRIVYIYGIRQTGERFCRKLEQGQGFLIGGFLAADAEDGPQVFMGRKVEDVRTARIPEDAVVVVATKQIFWEEVRGILEQRNIPCVFHRRL